MCACAPALWRAAFHSHLVPCPPRAPPPLCAACPQVDSIKELVTDTNLECSATGIMLQAMDSSHVALVSLSLKTEGFDMFRCDRNISLGLNLVRARGHSPLAHPAVSARTCSPCCPACAAAPAPPAHPAHRPPPPRLPAAAAHSAPPRPCPLRRPPPAPLPPFPSPPPPRARRQTWPRS